MTYPKSLWEGLKIGMTNQLTSYIVLSGNYGKWLPSVLDFGEIVFKQFWDLVVNIGLE